MEAEVKIPASLQEAITYFPDGRVCHDLLTEIRWPGGVTCPHCGSERVGLAKTRLIWNCNTCTRQFSANVGTIFEDSPLKLSTWLPAAWLIVNA